MSETSRYQEYKTKVKSFTDEQLKEEMADWGEEKSWVWMNAVTEELFGRWSERSENAKTTTL